MMTISFLTYSCTMDFFLVWVTTMAGAFQEISSSLDRRLGPEEHLIDYLSATNPSFSENPSLALVQQSLDRGRSDQPALTPTQGTCDSWGEHVSPEQESLPNNPLTVNGLVGDRSNVNVGLTDSFPCLTCVTVILV